MDDSRAWAVYALVDPRNSQVRYIGWTTNQRVRLRDHCKPSRLLSGTRRDNWIKLLIQIGLLPILEVLEEGVGPAWPASEQRWIAHFRSLGADLTNHTDGGEGAYGRKHTAKAKAAMSEKRKGRRPHPNTIAAARARKGISHTPVAAIAAITGKPKSAEHRRKIAETVRGFRHSDEARQKMREAAASRPPGSRPPMTERQKQIYRDQKTGKPNEGKRRWWATLTAEQRSAILKKGWETRNARQRDGAETA